jgi:hypothetical protein
MLAGKPSKKTAGKLCGVVTGHRFFGKTLGTGNHF